jgi:FeS cluster assembly scaffold protein NifU
MKSTQYSEKVLDHFRNPRNVGTLEGEDVSVGRVGNPVCGDLMEMYIKVKDNRIQDIKLKTFGCGSAIATASMISEMAKGKTLDEALKISRQDVADELDGLPPVKMHCSNLAADALTDAIKKYQEGKGTPKSGDKAENAKAEPIPGRDRFLGKGVYNQITDLSPLKDKRILILYQGTESVELAKKLTSQTRRVVLITRGKEDSVDSDRKKALKASGVKLLFESEILEIMGFKVVEKVHIHDLNEDDEYDLYMDAVILL